LGQDRQPFAADGHRHGAVICGNVTERKLISTRRRHLHLHLAAAFVALQDLGEQPGGIPGGGVNQLRLGAGHQPFL